MAVFGVLVGEPAGCGQAGSWILSTWLEHPTPPSHSRKPPFLDDTNGGIAKHDIRRCQQTGGFHSAVQDSSVFGEPKTDFPHSDTTAISLLKALRSAPLEVEGFNVHRDLLITAAKAAIMASLLDDQFALADVGLHGNIEHGNIEHGNIEHDASVSRVDKEPGDHLPFNEEVFSILANSNPGVDYYNTTSTGIVQKIRLEQSQAENPKLVNTVREIQIRTRESALYLAVMPF
ncbi:hypothetical protein AAF712_007834 [Marasmius tenuissimus]|uniref:Heme haloperoxidase family profile domain-containing protein n=1 Tax=Marasmius tenuissimus TaxID=585030 RepID=A0ABR2ZVI8_9AGAR